MLSISSLSSPNAATAYYCGKAGSYYAGQNGRSSWHGGAAGALKLPEGEVRPDYLNALLAGRLPHGQQLGAMRGDKLLRNCGRDFTVSLPKSVSILALGSRGDDIYQAAAKAAAGMMDFYEANMARTRRSNAAIRKQEIIGNQKIVYAMFPDNVSRANDPHGHIHIVVPSVALGEDGKFRSLKFNLAYEQKILLGAIFRGFLAKELKQEGFELSPAGKHGLWEIKDVPQEAIELFSQRRRAMLAAAKDGPTDPLTMAHLVLKDRPKKQDMAPGVLEAKWIKDLAKLGHGFKQLVQKALRSEPTAEFTPEKALGNAVADLSETERHFHKFDLLKAGLVSTYGNISVDDLQAQIDYEVAHGTLVQSKDGEYYTTEKMLRIEQSVLDAHDQGLLKGGIIGAEDFEAYNPELGALTEGQKEGVELVLVSKSRTIGVNGLAGTGKTRLLENTLPAIVGAGYQAIGLAPTTGARDELAKHELFYKTMTLQAFLQNPEGNNKTVLVLDEASMVGTRDMRDLIRFANLKSMRRLALLGDDKQFKAIAAGEPFKDLQKAGMRTVNMEEIVRQKDPRHVKGITELAHGKISSAMQTLKKEIVEVPIKDISAYAASLWIARKDPQAAIVVPTNRQKAWINAVLKQHVQHNKQEAGGEAPINVLRPLYFTGRKRRAFYEYADATHIQFLRDANRLGVKSGETFEIIGRNAARYELKLSDGKKTITFVPATHGKDEGMTAVFRQDDITLSTGDRVRFTRGMRGGHINTNDMGTVTKIENGTVTFDLDKGKTAKLPLGSQQLRHLDHAWANTGYAFQGKTVTSAIAVLPSHKSPLTTLESLYVGASRHRESLTIITDDCARLETTLKNDYNLKSEDIEFRTGRIAEPEPIKEKSPEVEPYQEPKQYIDLERGDRSR